MKKLLLIVTILFTTCTYVNAKQKCSDLPGFKKMGKDSMEYLKCLRGSKKIKLNTDSKLTNWISGKEKIKFPNPLKGIKKIGEAVKPAPITK